MFNSGLSSMHQFAATQHSSGHSQIDAMAAQMCVLKQMMLNQDAALARLSEENAQLKRFLELHTTQLAALVEMAAVTQQSSFSYKRDTHGHFSASSNSVASSTPFSPELTHTLK